MKFSELQQQLKEKYGIDHLSDIAREFGVSPQAVSNWKARDRVPYKYVIELRKLIDIHKTEVVEKESNNNEITSREIKENVKLRINSTISIPSILLLFTENLKFIIITNLILIITTTIYLLTIQPIYESSAKLLPNNNENSTGQYAALASQFGVTMPGPTNSTSVYSSSIYPDIIKSTALGERVVKHEYKTMKFGSSLPLFQLLTSGNEKFTGDYDQNLLDGINIYKDMVKIGTNYNTPIINITVTAFEPKLAADIANIVILELNNLLVELKTKRIKKKKRFIEDRIENVKSELSESEEALKSFRNQNRNLGGSPTLKLQEERFSRDVQVKSSMLMTLKRELEIVKIEVVEQSEMVEVLEYPQIPLIKSNPSRKRTLLIITFLGLGFSLGVILVKDNFTRSEDSEKYMQIKMLLIKTIKSFYPFKKKNY